MRIQHRREFYIPKGAMKFADRQSSAVVYAFTSKSGQPALMGFHGRAQKPDFHYRFRNEAHREAHARQFFERWRANDAHSRKRKVADRALAVGDVLRCSWGYDQTNVDFFEVTALIGKAMVEIREIAQEAEGDWTGRCVPVPGKFIGKPLRKRAQGDSVRIYSFAHAYRMEPRALIGGKPVFDASSFTAYA